MIGSKGKPILSWLMRGGSLDLALVTLEEIVGLPVLSDLNKTHIGSDTVPVGSLITVPAVSKGVEGLRISKEIILSLHADVPIISRDRVLNRLIADLACDFFDIISVLYTLDRSKNLPIFHLYAWN
jgi:hypothetical protein